MTRQMKIDTTSALDTVGEKTAMADLVSRTQIIRNTHNSSEIGRVELHGVTKDGQLGATITICVCPCLSS